MKFFILIVKGFFLGLSMVLPGVSGGTLAFIMGIYEKLIQEISLFKSSHIRNILKCFSFNKKQIHFHFSKLQNTWDWSFLIPLMFGVLSAPIGFILFTLEWIEKNNFIFYSLICGLVLASMISPFKQMKKSLQTFLFFFVSLIFNLAIFFYGKEFFILSKEIPSFLFFPIGFIVSIAFLVPGLSGSYLLLILGLYEKTLLAFKNLDFFIIGFFLLGGISGFILSAKGIQKLLQNYWNQSLACILGLILGSLYSLYPLKTHPFIWDREQKLFLFYMTVGFLLFLLFHFYLGKKNKKTLS
ncbi:MAG: DUF368 domain-containing protein [Bdellovibrionales bacterium]|nr:DUF368 domain-containing protein [Bdellovibrionales bacterium]